MIDVGERVNNRRDTAIDLCKALAICAVVCIHCSAGHLVGRQVGSLQWLSACFWGVVSRWAVAVFVLCSGAVMNAPERELPLKKLFSRYLLRLALALSVWAGLYEGMRLYFLRGSSPLSELVVQCAKNWLTGNTWYHLYYFYFAIALYLALPLTRLIARHASRQELRYILALWLLSGGVFSFLQCFPPFNQLNSFLLQYSLSPIVLVPGLGLLGWYLHQSPPKGWTEGLILFLAGFGATFSGTWRHSVAAGALDGLYLSGFSPFVLLMAAGIFRLCQRWADCPASPRGERASGLIQFLSQGSFCVFLIHPFFQGLDRRAWFESLPSYWAIPAQAALLLSLSYGAYWFLRRIPAVNRWLI